MISRKTFIACNSVYFAKRNCNTAGQQSNSKVITLLDVASWWWWVGWLERRNGVLCKITVNDYFTPRSSSNAKKKGTEWDVCCSASLQMECLLVFHVRVKFRGCRPPHRHHPRIKDSLVLIYLELHHHPVPYDKRMNER